MAYLDKTGLTELWKKVKSYVDANGEEHNNDYRKCRISYKTPDDTGNRWR